MSECNGLIHTPYTTHVHITVHTHIVHSIHCLRFLLKFKIGVEFVVLNKSSREHFSDPAVRRQDVKEEKAKMRLPLLGLIMIRDSLGLREDSAEIKQRGLAFLEIIHQVLLADF